MDRIIEIQGATEEIPDERTLADSGFYWRDRGGLKVLVCRPLEAAGFVNGFSTRLGGVSPFPDGDLNLAGYDEDTAENIAENRRRFLSLFERPFTLATAWQVHGADVKVVSSSEDASRTEERFDALVSKLDGVLLGVKTADCVPLLLGDPVTGAFGAVHAGWRGSAASIVRAAVKKLQDVFGTDPKNIVAAIGPSATCRNYEIGEDVIRAFERHPGSEKYFEPTREGHALIDLVGFNRDELIDLGVRPENIFIAPYCTIERTDLFFSYRKEKSRLGKTGRLLSVIGKAGSTYPRG